MEHVCVTRVLYLWYVCVTPVEHACVTPVENVCYTCGTRVCYTCRAPVEHVFVLHLCYVCFIPVCYMCVMSEEKCEKKLSSFMVGFLSIYD